MESTACKRCFWGALIATIFLLACEDKETPIEPDGKTHELIFAATYEQGIFKSEDGGTTWEASNSGLTDLNTFTIIAPENDSGLFAGTLNNGVFRSDKRGSGWVPANAGISEQRIFQLVVNSKGDIFANQGNMIFRTTDNGQHWSDITNGIDRSIRTLAVGAGDEILAGTSGGLLKSSDNGNSWQRTSFDIDVDRVVTDAKAGEIYIGTELWGMFRSSDGGTTWQAISSGTPEEATFGIGIHPLSGDIYAGVGLSLYRSRNKGDSWVEVLSLHHIAWSIFFLQTGGILVGTLSPSEDEVGAGDGLYRSPDQGESWTRSGLSALNVLSFAAVSQ